jgi:hypothetical protein
MKRTSKLVLYTIGILIIIIAAFLAGAISYRSGIISEIRSRLLPQPTQTPALPTLEIDPGFSFEFIEDPSEAAMNSIPLQDDHKPVKFLVSGHVYGKPGDDEFHPAITLINNVALLRNLEPDFMVFLGDTVWKPTAENFNTLELLVLDPLKIPVFNAVGNHDVTKRDVYQTRYGNTVFAFEFKNQLIFFLDTTLIYYELSPGQLSFIRDTIEDQIQTSDISAIHLFMHHVLFLKDDEIFGKQHLKPNEGDGTSKTFQDFLRSTLHPVSESIPIFVYAGDVGAYKPGNLSPLYKEDPKYDITYLATGLGNHQNDSILILEQNANLEFTITPFSLTGKELKPIETYDFQYWLSK